MIKQKVITNYWEEEVCGTRFSNQKNLRKYFKEIAYKRYSAEPYIKGCFGDSKLYKNKRLLEME